MLYNRQYYLILFYSDNFSHRIITLFYTSKIIVCYSLFYIKINNGHFYSMRSKVILFKIFISYHELYHGYHETRYLMMVNCREAILNNKITIDLPNNDLVGDLEMTYFNIYVNIYYLYIPKTKFHFLSR